MCRAANPLSSFISRAAIEITCVSACNPDAQNLFIALSHQDVIFVSMNIFS